MKKARKSPVRRPRAEWSARRGITIRASWISATQGITSAAFAANTETGLGSSRQARHSRNDPTVDRDPAADDPNGLECLTGRLSSSR
jgi:hypothetical protein